MYNSWINILERIIVETLYKLYVCERVKFIILGTYLPNNFMLFINL